MFTVIMLCDARGESACNACAIRLLPVPFSPVMSTFASDGATCEIISTTGRIDGASAIMFGTFPARSLLAASSFRPLRNALASFGQDLGLAFQIADYLLDQDGDAAQTGKAVRKDADRGKPTAVSVLGPERARIQAQALATQASRHLDLFDEKADLLRAAAGFVVQRRA